MRKILLASLILSTLLLSLDAKCQAKKAVSIKAIGHNYLVEINTRKFKGDIKPYSSEKLIENTEVFKRNNAIISLNGGFFDPKHQDTISWVLVDGKVVSSPMENKHLVGNNYLRPYLDRILNRSEFRILNCQGKKSYDIKPHYSPVAKGCFIEHSIQGGPQLYPELRLEEEFFILKKNNKIVRESASATKKRARTGVGIKGDKIVFIIVPKKPGMSLLEFSDFCKKLKLDKAMALDGGSSTSMIYKSGRKLIEINSARNDQDRKIKSFILVTKQN